ncbi:nucleotide-binding domain-containing protein [Rhizophagus irregularis]|nr:nucleotide-binding domain-containing protein [Rhizophagus irregularis]
MLNKRIVVLGAGVSGLTTATLLLQQEKAIKVHIVAKHFPGDLSGEYTSPWAGAHWRSHAAKDEIREQEFDRETYKYFWKIANTPYSGVMIIDEFEYWEKLPQDFSDPWFKTLCHEYRHLRKEELPVGVEFGITYKSISINPSTYLNYLLNTFTSLGGTTQRANLSHLNECIESDTDIVVNCSGIHARTLGGVEDSDVFPVRDQTVIAQLPQSYMNWAFFKREANGEMTYAIPRDNGEVTLGGTYEVDNYSTDVDYDTAAAIIHRCLATRPDLLPKDQPHLIIKMHGVGLRPHRKGGVRVETEWTTSEKFGKKILICHNYGHGGSGYQSSYSTAQSALKIMKEILQS